MSDLLVSIPSVFVTGKGLERKKELQIVAVAAPSLENDPRAAAEAVAITSTVFQGVTPENPITFGGDGWRVYYGPMPAELSIYIGIIEVDGNFDAADFMREKVLKRPDVQLLIQTAASAVPVVGPLISQIAAAVTDLIGRDTLLAEYRYYKVGAPPDGEETFARLKAGGVLRFRQIGAPE